MPVFNLLVIYLTLFFGEIAHPIKMSTSKVAVNVGDQKLEVVSNFYFDDFRHHLESLYHSDLTNIGSNEEAAIEKYFQNHFTITTNTKEPVVLKIASATLVDQNMMQIKMEASPYFSIESVSSLKITNTLLLDAFPKEQENIVHVVLKETYDTQLLRFSQGESRQLVRLD